MAEAMAIAAAPLAIGGTLLQAGGAIYNGTSAKAAADANANVMRNNASMDAAAAGQREEAMRRNARQVAGQQRAAIAESGGGFGGSAADIMAQSAAAAELDALTVRYDAETRAIALGNEATITQRQGKRARTAGYLDAAGSMLSGAANYSAVKGGGGRK